MKIGFKNLRSLVNTGNLSIKPMTILLGQNSSGKSTFLRTFPLLKQSIETRTTGPILWYGRFVDFGDFSNALNESENSKNDFIEYSFELDFNKENINRYYRKKPVFENIERNLDNCLVAIQLKGDKENKTYTSKMQIVFNDFDIEIVIGKNKELESIFIDGIKIKSDNLTMVNLNNGFLPTLFLLKDDENHFALSSERFSLRKIFKEISSISNRKLSDETILKILNQLNFNSNKELFDSIIKQDIVKGFANKVKDWEIENDKYINLKNHLITSAIPSLISLCDSKITSIANSTSYIAPLRATAERYYRPQDLNVDEVDFQGKNLALVLRNFSQSERNEFEKWCLNNFSFFPRAKILGGNISVTVNFKNNSGEHNIADLGFGFSQILPVIVQIWTGSLRKKNKRYRRYSGIKIYAIEQPELHLHPKIQALIVDALISVINFVRNEELSVYFILETHSETIVNAIGTRIYKKKIDKNDVNVIIFERENNKPKSQVYEVKYSDDGTLKNWPYGFFEEEWQF
ncbi:AAA family ATPase [uncultured Tenacibaculum sp.]|uniref:AAA family ATPase n=1 Tax=uncultured Tenacibaculum sp. TaxID=174713 RepID=UPI0026391358|nr:AAA family ATPase [uncultured Tenacibaculum sp.]